MAAQPQPEPQLSASPQDIRPAIPSQRSRFMLAVAGAIGGALLTIGSSAALEAYKAHIVTEQGARQSLEEQQRKDREATLQVLRNASDSYDDLGDLPRRATEYVESGRDGRPEDVRTIYRHFSRFMRVIRVDAASADDLTRYYGVGVVGGWGDRFIRLGTDKAPTSNRFSNLEKSNFRALGSALSKISQIVRISETNGSTVGEVSAGTTIRSPVAVSGRKRAKLSLEERTKETPGFPDERSVTGAPKGEAEQELGKEDVVVGLKGGVTITGLVIDARIRPVSDEYSLQVKGDVGSQLHGTSTSPCEPPSKELSAISAGRIASEPRSSACGIGVAKD
jgi:hypothetical protein